MKLHLDCRLGLGSHWVKKKLGLKVSESEIYAKQSDHNLRDVDMYKCTATKIMKSRSVQRNLPHSSAGYKR